MALGALPADEWMLFHDVKWPGRRQARIDHVAVGPPGIFVIASLNWSGRITVRCDILRQNGRSREPAVARGAEAAAAVRAMTSVVDPRHVLGALCFVRDEPLHGGARDVMVCSHGELAGLLVGRERVLSPDLVREAALELDAQFQYAGSPMRTKSHGKRRKRRSAARTLAQWFTAETS